MQQAQQLIAIQLPVASVNNLLNVLAQLPNSSATFGTMVEIQQQAQAQIDRLNKDAILTAAKEQQLESENSKE